MVNRTTTPPSPRLSQSARECGVMISPPDPFAHSSNSIDDQRHADAETIAAFAAHNEAVAAPRPVADGPGFYLIDDANGRFTIDKGMGIVSLRHEHLLSKSSAAPFIRCGSK